MTFTLVGLVVGVGCIYGLLKLVDFISVRRGLGYAHPLSPAVAYALLAGVILLGVFVLIGLSVDHAALVRP